jgi:hypothetical protein
MKALKIEEIRKSQFQKDKNTIGKVLIECLMVGTIIVTGIPSRTQYIFTPENRVVPVLLEDVNDLLSKRQRLKPCCNADERHPPLFRIFETE